MHEYENFKILMSTNNNVSRGERILNRLVTEQKITESGKDWLVAALDPFHDYQLKHLAGWPDVQVGASVVRACKQSVTIQAPSGVTGNWDCHIVQWPWLSSTQTGSETGNFTALGRIGQNISMPGAGTIQLKVGGLQVYYVPTGQPLSITGGTTQLMATIDVPQTFTKGVTRLIGGGFEVHNTTSPLNRQGSCLVYRQMSNENENFTWTMRNATETSVFSGPKVRYPPKDAKEALLLAGSRQWEASDGSYSVFAFHSTENPATVISPCVPVIEAVNADDLEGSLATTAVNAAIPSAAVTNGFRPHVGFRVHNIHQSGVIYSGLSAQTTLTINQNVFLETFPSSAEEEILPLATPSAAFDPLALSGYSYISCELPVGVPVAENGLGDWFYDAASLMASKLAPVLQSIPHPLAQGAGMVAQGMAAAMAPKKKKVKNKQNPAVPPMNSWGPPPRLPKRDKAYQNAVKVLGKPQSTSRAMVVYQKPKRRQKR